MTALITAHDFTLKAGDRLLASKIDFSIEDTSRIGLVGVNGTGKSTLLKALLSQDSFIRKNGLRIAYLSQHPNFAQTTIKEAMTACSSKPEYELASAVTKLGLAFDDTPIESLSGGGKRRLALAMTLVQEADLLLLDEPTNHLDIDMIEWLQVKLTRSKTPFVLITHDRYFLDALCTRIWELADGGLYEYEGNFSTYLEAASVRAIQQQAAAHKLERLYQQELAWVKAGVQARSTKSKSRLDRFVALQEARTKRQEENLCFVAPSHRLGKQVIDLENLSFGYDKPLFSNLTYKVLPNDRLGILGPNGCGKSTLLSLFAGKLKPSSGHIWLGQTVRIGYFQQMDEGVDLSQSMLAYCEEVASQVTIGKHTLSVTNLLERFMFTSSQMHLPIDRLSGGQRRRLYLCRLLLSGPNVLLLDEPTNDLDIQTLEILEDYLDDFVGAVIVISHDRYFLDRVCNHALVYDHHQFVLSNELRYSKEVVQKERAIGKRVRLFTSTDRNRLQAVEKRLEQIENQLTQLEQTMNEADYESLTKLSSQRDALEQEQEGLSEEWLVLSEKKEASRV